MSVRMPRLTRGVPFKESDLTAKFNALADAIEKLYTLDGGNDIGFDMGLGGCRARTLGGFKGSPGAEDSGYAGPWAIKDLSGVDGGTGLWVNKIGIDLSTSFGYYSHYSTLADVGTVSTSSSNIPHTPYDHTHNVGLRALCYDSGILPALNQAPTRTPLETFVITYANMLFDPGDTWAEVDLTDDFFEQSGHQHAVKTISDTSNKIWAVLLRFGDENHDVFTYNAYAHGGWGYTDMRAYLSFVEYGVSGYNNSYGVSQIIGFVKIRGGVISDIKQVQQGPVCAGMARRYYNNP